MTVDRADRRGVALVFGAAAALGTLGVISGLAYDAGMSAPVFTALRAALGASILGFLVLTHRQPGISLRALPSGQRRMLAIAIVANGSMNLLLFAGLDVMTVALVMACYYTYPLIVLVVQAARGHERITPTRVAALALAMAGLALLIGRQVGPDADVSMLGIGLGLGAAACQATYLIVSRDGYLAVPAVQATSLILLGGLLIAGSAALLTGGAATLGSWTGEPVAWLAVLIAGTLGAAIPKVMVLLGVRRIGGTRTATIMVSEPVMAVIFAAVVLGQALTTTDIIGGGAILLGAALAQRQVTRDDPTPQAADRVAALARE